MFSSVSGVYTELHKAHEVCCTMIAEKLQTHATLANGNHPHKTALCQMEVAIKK